MEAVKATLWIYQIAFSRSIKLVAANPGIILAPLAYSVVVSLAAILFSPLWFVGGLVVTAVTAACMSSGLHLIENVVRIGKVDLNDFIKGFSVYLWEILGIAFILWIPMTLLSRVSYSAPEGPMVLLIVQLLLYVILNAVPELIYQSRVSGLALLSASYHFIVENWIEWFLPNVLITVAAFMLLGPLRSVAVHLPFFLQFFFVASAFGLFLTFLMIFRGILFSELNGTTRRSRVFRYKTQG
ncbi:MAG TPA: hypothetical protein VGR30_16260 [Candidatus Binatia bacterium]|jgi:hypothetical protein|nr:hypothetical protein [Candidatus Binatia bacterium]